MPELAVVETTVYTLAELEELFGASVHEKAVNKVLEWAWEGFEPEFVTEDIAYMIGEDFKCFDMDQCKQGRNGKGETTYRPHLFWGMNPYSAECTGSVRVYQFMIDKKLRRKYALLWAIIKKWDIHHDAAVAFGKDVDLDDLLSDIESYDDTDYKPKRYANVQAQLKGLEGDIYDYVNEIYSFVLNHLRAEDDYRSSEEYAKDEAESMELKFEEDGSIYHG